MVDHGAEYSCRTATLKVPPGLLSVEYPGPLVSARFAGVRGLLSTLVSHVLKDVVVQLIRVEVLL